MRQLSRKVILPLIWLWAKLIGQSQYVLMQKLEYRNGTSDHEEHNDNPDIFTYMLNPVLEFLASRPDPVAFELGCGKGRNLQNLIDLGFVGEVQGADISRTNVEFCRKRFPLSRFEATPGSSLFPFPSESVDVVFSTIVLQHIPVWDIRNSLLSESHRILKSSGRIYIQMGFGPNLKTPSGKKLAGYHENLTHAFGSNGSLDVQIRTESEILEHLTVVGFRVDRVEVRPSFSDNQHSEWIFVSATKV